MNQPVLVRTIAEWRWKDATMFFIGQNIDRIRIERRNEQPDTWEYWLERDNEDSNIVYQDTYRNGARVQRREVRFT